MRPVRALAVVLFLVGLALLGNRYTIAFGILLAIGAAVLFDKAGQRASGGEAVFVGLLMLAGAVGAVAVLVSYLTALP